MPEKPQPSDDSTKALSLDEIRTSITQIDNQLLSLLAQRREISLQVAINKQSELRPIRDLEREVELLKALIHRGKEKKLDSNYVTRLYHIIIQDSVELQQRYVQSQLKSDNHYQSEKRIATLGGPGAYSYLAANKYFGSDQNTYLGFNSFEKVITSVEQGETDFGVLPIENTTSGGITEVYDLLLDSNLNIVGEEKYPIKHCLVASKKAQLSDIEEILAHPEAKKQCIKKITKLGEFHTNLVSSTAEAVQRVSNDSTGQLAAIASKKAAHQFGLKVLVEDIATIKENTTRFLVVAPEPRAVSIQVSCKTSLALSTSQKPGSLAEALLVFSDANIPLTKLESRPIADKPWEQMFYIDLQGNIADKMVKEALQEVVQHCLFLKVLGCYPTQDTKVANVAPKNLIRANTSVLRTE